MKLIEDRTLPYHTQIPGLGGVLKSRPEDFVVEEIPAYLPCGEGEHLFLWIEKRNLDSRSMLQHLSKTLSIGRNEIGIAGMKDRIAVTRQYVSVPARCQESVGEISSTQLQILDAKLHRNKLRTGHLKGNRFTILIRDFDRQIYEEHFESLVEKIASQGFPNYFGEQRFGIENRNIALGLELLRGEKKPCRLPGKERKFLMKMSITAVQSWLYNCVVAKRIDEGTVSQVLRGDVMQKTETGGCFVVEDVEVEKKRMAAGETVITGPMFGCKTMTANDRAGEIEADVLSSANLTGKNFERFPKIARGTRRPFLAFAEDLRFEKEQEALRLCFSLNSGVYATSLLREMMKPESSDEDDSAD